MSRILKFQRLAESSDVAGPGSVASSISNSCSSCSNLCNPTPIC